MQNYFILWHGVNEWEEFNGTLEDAIKHIKSDARYKNYGHQGAMVIASSIHYEIAVDGTEYHKEAAKIWSNCGRVGKDADLWVTFDCVGSLFPTRRQANQAIKAFRERRPALEFESWGELRIRRVYWALESAKG